MNRAYRDARLPNNLILSSAYFLESLTPMLRNDIVQDLRERFAALQIPDVMQSINDVYTQEGFGCITYLWRTAAIGDPKHAIYLHSKSEEDVTYIWVLNHRCINVVSVADYRNYLIAVGCKIPGETQYSTCITELLP